LKRSLRRDRLKYSPPAELPDRAPATAKEVAILPAREMYDHGDFRRAVARRVPSDLFSDDLVLECGHTSGAARARANKSSMPTAPPAAGHGSKNETKAKLKT
jgi:hypothetical protein